MVADDQAALLIDWSFMATVIEAAGNLVFRLIMNSVREIYLPSAAPFVRLSWPSGGSVANGEAEACTATPRPPRGGREAGGGAGTADARWRSDAGDASSRPGRGLSAWRRLKVMVAAGRRPAGHTLLGGSRSRSTPPTAHRDEPL